VYDVYPNPLPDLFSGSQVIVMGRYHQSGTFDITLKGVVDEQTQTFRYNGVNFTEDSRGAGAELSSLPRLWATRKIGYLLNQVRLKGADQETIDQIVKLSIRYGIVTQYTSYLVTENNMLGADAQQHVAQEALKQFQAAPSAASGAGAVQRAADQGALSQALQAPTLSGSASQTVAQAGGRTMVFTDGKWTDTAYDPKKMTPAKVAFLSKEYFQLVQDRPDAAAALALGAQVIVVIDGKAYEITAESTAVPSATLPPAITALPTRAAVEPTPGVGATPETQPVQPSDPGRTGNLDTSTVVIATIAGLAVLGLIFVGVKLGSRK